ncbi:MAG: nucleotidyl transferase AbiEii/AbiGii toxin family protein [Acidobacteriota bacterium]
MRAPAIWKAVTMDQANFLESLLAVLAQEAVRYCVIGGQAVNAYAEPLVSLDLDLVVAADQIESLASTLARHFKVERFPHSLNVSMPGSDLRVRIQTDPRYPPFLERASMRDVLGVRLPVASIEDVFEGKVWAALDPERRPSKRRKDLLDIERLVEAHPDLRGQVPEEIRELLRI